MIIEGYNNYIGYNNCNCFPSPLSQSKKDEVMRKRRNINVDEDEDVIPGGVGPVLTIEALQSLVMVGVAF